MELFSVTANQSRPHFPRWVRVVAATVSAVFGDRERLNHAYAVTTHKAGNGLGHCRRQLLSLSCADTARPR